MVRVLHRQFCTDPRWMHWVDKVLPKDPIMQHRFSVVSCNCKKRQCCIQSSFLTRLLQERTPCCNPERVMCFGTFAVWSGVAGCGHADLSSCSSMFRYILVSNMERMQNDIGCQIWNPSLPTHANPFFEPSADLFQICCTHYQLRTWRAGINAGCGGQGIHSPFGHEDLLVRS